MDRRGMLLRCLQAVIVVVLVGCPAAPPRLLAINPGAEATAQKASPTLIRGRVDFPVSRRAQATSDQVIKFATVSLIDTETSATVASGTTDNNGEFTISLGLTTPGAQAYILEAVRGLANNAPGNDAARFRTILRFQSGEWASCTNSVPGVGQIIINAQTTALAIESALDPARVAPLETIGDVNITTVPPTFYTPLEFDGHSDQEFADLATDLLNFLTADIDPISAVPAVLPTISSFQPASAFANDVVRITGNGFSPTLMGNTVTFASGQVASVMLARPDSLFVTVPSAAVTGTVKVQTGRGTTESGSAFTVTTAAGSGNTNLSIVSFAPASGRAGTPVTLTGQFGSTQGNVYFTGPSTAFPVNAPITSWGPTSIVVTVPTGAQYGRISVKSGVTTVTSVTDFDTWLGDLSYMTNTYLGTSYPGAYSVPNSGYGQSIATYYSTPGNQATAQYIYVIGGSDNTAVGFGPGYTANNGGLNVFMWTVAADGTLGSAKHVGRLRIPRLYHNAVIVGNFLYVIGGIDNQAAATYTSASAQSVGGPAAPFTGPVLRSIERAYINPADGSLSMGTTVNGTKGEFDQLGDVLSTGGRQNHSSYTGKIGATTYIWCVSGQGPTTTIRADYDQFSVDTSTGVLTTVKADATLSGPGGAPISIHQGSGQLIGTGILIVGGYRNNAVWSGSLHLPINQTNGNLDTNGSYGTNNTLQSCPSYTNEYGGQLVYLKGLSGPQTAKVYMFAGNHLEINQGAVNPVDGTMTGTAGTPGFACASVGAPNTSARNQQYSSLYNDQAAVVTNGGVNRIYQFGGQGLSYAIQATQVNADGSLNRPHQWGSTRDGIYYNAGLTLGNRAWVIGGYRGTDATYTNATEYYPMRDDGILGSPVMGPALNKVRGFPQVTTWSGANSYVYVLGGYNPTDTSLDTIERAPINLTTGVISPFTVLPNRLNIRNYQGVAVTVGNWIYVVGGYNATTGVLGTVERAPINPDGSLGSFEILQNYLPYTTYQHSMQQIGNYLYLMGGYGGSIGSQMVLRAQVYPNGDISPFTRAPGSDVTFSGPLPGVAAYGVAVKVFGNYFYRCGGNSDGTNCNRAAINLDGTLQSWQTWSPYRAILPNSKTDSNDMTMYRWNDRVFMLGSQTNDRIILTTTLR